MHVVASHSYRDHPSCVPRRLPSYQTIIVYEFAPPICCPLCAHINFEVKGNGSDRRRRIHIFAMVAWWLAILELNRRHLCVSHGYLYVWLCARCFLFWQCEPHTHAHVVYVRTVQYTRIWPRFSQTIHMPLFHATVLLPLFYTTMPFTSHIRKCICVNCGEKSYHCIQGQHTVCFMGVWSKKKGKKKTEFGDGEKENGKYYIMCVYWHRMIGKNIAIFIIAFGEIFTLIICVDMCTIHTKIIFHKHTINFCKFSILYCFSVSWAVWYIHKI